MGRQRVIAKRERERERRKVRGGAMEGQASTCAVHSIGLTATAFHQPQSLSFSLLSPSLLSMCVCSMCRESAKNLSVGERGVRAAEPRPHTHTHTRTHPHFRGQI